MNAVLLGCAALALCATAVMAQNNVPSKSIEESRALAAQVASELRTQLIREMQISGPLRSLVVCKFTCPEIISAPSRRTGWRVSAVSLKPRNPAMGAADPWEQKVLLEFARRVARGEKADGLEFWEVVNEPQGAFFRYAMSMPVDPLCLACHGTPDAMSQSVKTQLATDYPKDRATGFAVGEVYGIVAVKRPH